MEKGKLGIGMSKYDNRVEELEDILKHVMRYVDSFLESCDFDKSEIERAMIMKRRVTEMLAARDAKIDDLDREMRRKQFYRLIGR